MANTKAKKKYTSKINVDEKFYKILSFYMIETPIEGTSHRGKTFKELGWYGSSRFQMLERLLKSTANMNDSQWNICDNQSEVRKKSKDVALDNQFIFSDQSKGRVQTFIYSIRNAFAHGSFDILEVNDKKYYLFENEYKGNYRSKLFLEEETLLKWIKIINTKPEYLTKKARRKREQNSN